jgi:hypothetical protein
LSTNANGNLTGRATDSVTYDQADRLTQGGRRADQHGPYDGDGKRVTHTGEQFGTATYTTDVNQSLPVILDDGTLKYVWGANGLVYDVSHDGTVIEVHHQVGLSTTRVLTDASGNPLGSPTLAWGQEAPAAVWSGPPSNFRSYKAPPSRVMTAAMWRERT